ncbi:hypothetical protein CERSUDRAFT_90510 [Gelatoporia subvermispora B]|uniref:PB1 domain-containing protein n=1 Tax=Ceriporiopsis subvermispora (strain B) TaxID=914234 RepID=M2RU12_CERS8|nr:hypothetical protein CERSUDRAFT_90510 [Gelatoporia subvermispora B]
MSPVHVKLRSPSEGLTRAVTFQEQPSWVQLAARIHSLFHVPLANIGVSYFDTEGDEVTLSTEEELQDFYRTAPQHATGDLKTYAFKVRDLGAIRESDKPLPATPGEPNLRNTFGQSIPLVFDFTDDDWQRVPMGLGGVFVPGGGRNPESPHAFVEVLDSDADISQEIERDTASTVTMSEASERTPTGEDKGKGKAREDTATRTDVSSTESVLSSESPDKHPVHVYNLSNLSNEDIFGIRNVPPPPPLRAEASTVNMQVDSENDVPVQGTTPATARAEDPEYAPDPPLPDIEPAAAPGSNASLANDVANLFSTLSTVFTSHPELVDGVRNIVRNARTGAYWNAHREAVARAAEEFRRSTEIGAEDVRRAAEDAAGRRVAEAVENIMRALGDTVGTGSGGSSGGSSDATAGTTPPVTSTPAAQGTRARTEQENRESWRQGNWIWGRGGHRGPPPHWPPRGHGPHHGHHGRHAWPFPGPPDRFQPPMPPMPPMPLMPPPPPHMPPFPPPFPGMMPGSWPPAPPPIPPPPVPQLTPGSIYDPSSSPQRPQPPPGTGAPFRAARTNPNDMEVDSLDDVEHAEVTMYGVASRPSKPNQGTKESLQAAKERYKAEKERYRQEREDRKKERERRRNFSGDSMQISRETSGTSTGVEISPRRADASGAEAQVSSPAVDATPRAPTQIISNARGPYPQLEMYSIPRRSHTMHGSGHHRNVSDTPSSSETAAAREIIKKLGEMGFTSSMYPSLASKVNARFSRAERPVSQQTEDTIMTEVLEELLQASPVIPSAQASGSGAGGGSAEAQRLTRQPSLP